MGKLGRKEVKGLLKVSHLEVADSSIRQMWLHIAVFIMCVDWDL